MSVCVHPHVHVWACLASSACVSNTTRLWWTTLDVCESLLAEHNAEQPCLPLQLETKKKSQPGGHFEIPGAHLANPGNWGVYISATERGKRPDAPLEQLSSSVHRGITHLTVGDRPLRVCVSHGRRKGIERAMCKVIKHHMTTCSRET